ncbi:hypothetical protein [Microbacterium sp. MTN4-26]|uniref:hypothetical protein n=1 Tax=unclassified Microbacterium TaxID=2609290 RepID=UPI0036F1D8B6
MSTKRSLTRSRREKRFRQLRCLGDGRNGGVDVAAVIGVAAASVDVIVVSRSRIDTIAFHFWFSPTERSAS